MKGLLLLIVVATCYTLPTMSDCPPDDPHAPCICSKGWNQKLTIDCSNAQDVEELMDYFLFKFEEPVELEELLIEGSPIPYLTSDMFSPIQSRIISIRQNAHLTNVEIDTFGSTQDHVEVLQMDHNNLQVTDIFDAIANMKKLLVADLNKNGLTTVPDRAFAGLPELVNINLSNNRITKLGREAFADCPSLRNVYLFNNQINILPGRILALDPSVPVDPKENVLLYLYRNQIDEFERDAFDGITKPVQVDLRENRIRILPKKVFQPLLNKMAKKNASSIFILVDNPFVCDCRMRWLLENPDYFKIVTQLTCFDTNKLLESYHLEDIEECF